MTRALGLVVVLASIVTLDSAAAQAKTPAKSVRSHAPGVHCYQHYRAAHALNAAQPVAPQIAIANGVGGTVEVLVTVRSNGAIVDAQAISGPALLRQAAVEAARATTFVPEIRDCKSIPGAYSYFVDFNGT